MKVDTAKLILAAFPFQCELVVGGIGPEHQASMHQMLESIRDSKRTSLLLFPDETAKTLEDIVHQKKSTCSTATEASLRDQPPERGNNNDSNKDNNDINNGYDLIVLDGTWAQARKFHSRYFPPDDNNSSLQRVKLSEASVELLHNGSIESGHQLRRHEIPWRQVGTFEAFRLFLRDWSREFPSHNNNNNENEGRLEFWEQIESYQRIANNAALKELGPPRS
jgi:DTW domain-containing protein YfiP